MSDLLNPDYLKHLCQKYGLTPSRRYGQNFLICPEPVEAMLAAAELSKNDMVVEVGPGFGVLTFALAEKAKKVVAFEIEKKLKPYWEEKIKKLKNVEIVWGNVLMSLRAQRSNPQGIATPFGLAMTNLYKVAANLPYQITSNITRLFLEAENPPEMMVLMVQKEVAERICAKPGNMSVLSVAVQYYADPGMVMTVPRSCFWPEPEVDSAVVKLKIKNSKLKINESLRDDKSFFKVVKAGFSNRRKLLIKNLLPLVGKQHREKLENIFNGLGLSPLARAQELSVEQWRKLSRLCN